MARGRRERSSRAMLMAFIVELVFGALEVLSLLEVLSIWRFAVCVCAALILLAIAIDASGAARFVGLVSAGALLAVGGAWEWRFSRAA